LWQSVLLVKETGVPGENHKPVASHWQTLSHNVLQNYKGRQRKRKNSMYIIVKPVLTELPLNWQICSGVWFTQVQIA
jgi:hypothetical protein